MPGGGGAGGAGCGGVGGGGGVCLGGGYAGSYGASVRDVGTFEVEEATEEATDPECNGRAFALIMCIIFVVLSIIAGIVIGGGIGIDLGGFSESDSEIPTNFYSPGDSRLLSLSSFFCDEANLTLSSNSVNAELFLVDSAPPLNDTNNFTVTDQFSIVRTNYRFWQYHLYPNSNISISVLSTGPLVDVYIIKGNSNAGQWDTRPSVKVAEQSFLGVASLSNVQYSVQTEDEYYVIIHNSVFRTLSFTASLSFERFEYSAPTDPVDSCLVNRRGECFITIPYGLGSQNVLVTTSIPEIVDYVENIEVSVNCVRRHWAYAVVIVIPLAVLVVVTSCVIGAICCACRRKNSNTSNCSLS